MTREAENNIIAKILSGDDRAYGYFVDKYKAAVYNLAYRMTGQLQETEDLTQEIFFKAYASLKKFDVNRKFFPWLYAIALNTLRNHLKQKKPVVWYDEENANQKPAVANPHNPETMVSQVEAYRRLAEKMQKLPLLQQEAVVLRYYQELSFEDIAEILDVSLSAAKMRVYRGLEKLADLLKKEDNS
jgi:RNA polymerase sigma-70 factor (ECF subfamily)